MRAAQICLLLLTTLSGCASTGQPQRFWGQVAYGLLPFAERTDPGYAALARSGTPTLHAKPESGAPQVLRFAARQAEDETLWVGADGSGFTFKDGILVATRGVGADLMSSDVSQLRELLQAGRSGIAERFHSVLDGQGQVVLKSYVCTVTVRGETGQEDCSGLNETFINTYRIAPGSGSVQEVAGDAKATCDAT